MTLSREVGLWGFWILVSDRVVSIKRIEDLLIGFRWLDMFFVVHKWNMYREENENLYLRWVSMIKWNLVIVEYKI